MPPKRLVSVLSQAYEATINYSDGKKEVGEGSSRRLSAARLTASLLALGLDKLDSGGESTDDSDGYWLDDWEAEEGGELPRDDDGGDDDDRALDDIDNDEDQREVLSRQDRRRQKHFTDIILSKVIERGLPKDVPSKNDLTQRLGDPIRQHTDSLSMTKLVKNIRKLTERLGGLFQLQYSTIRIFHWTYPSRSLLAIAIYTLVVLHPNVIFILPLCYVLFGIMIPGYLYRHPLHRNNLHKLSERGDSLFNKFASVNDDKQLSRILDDSDEEQEVPELKENNSRTTRKNMEFFVNLRDLQNNLSKLVAVFDKIERFWYGTAGFKDERVSTSLFFTLATAIASLILVGPYIPWRFLLILIGWVLMIAIHPKVKPLIKQLKLLLQPKKQELDKLVKESERKDIVIDEEPEIRQVEVFEIWQKSFTSNEWEFYIFSSHVFHLEDEFRKSKNPPPGVLVINDVHPPKSWKFDPDDSWNIDYDCKEWCVSKGIELSPLQKVDKNNEFLIDKQFKRRRLFRDVKRYSRPSKKPPRLL
ncbi:unnamed protein product [Cyberlindnera jadinii]|uniref:TECPR1-like DysF domain-containing protein n=1 Tax=Cyberlindnera jadinii (strain ATCC 18201 / CBS 1600 / BCRC 20928 / JCM 3617 / NBRC 0987 / NRRL Y-1542) TaxID=983966 RepID=A0A0H5BZG7_CYBJN|nr:unnamed protein product [Cyberlindnera jadinii]